MLEEGIKELKERYDEADEHYFADEHSINFEFWSDLYYEVDGIAMDAVDIINRLQSEIKACDTAIKALRNELNESEDAYNLLYDYVEELESEIADYREDDMWND